MVALILHKRSNKYSVDISALAALSNLTDSRNSLVYVINEPGMWMPESGIGSV